MNNQIFDYSNLDERNNRMNPKKRLFAAGGIVAVLMLAAFIATPLIAGWLCIVAGVGLMYLVPDVATIKAMSVKAIAIVLLILMTGNTLITAGVMTCIHYVAVDEQHSPAEHYRLFNK